MKKLIWALTALIVVSSLFGNFQGFTAPLKKVEIILQSTAEGVSRDELIKSGEVLTARMEAFGITDFQVVPVFDKGQLKASFEEVENLNELFRLLTAKGAVRFCETNSRGEVAKMLTGLEGTQEFQSRIKLGSSDVEENNGSALLGSFGTGEIKAIAGLLNDKKLISRLPANLQFAWSRSPEQDGSYGLYALRFDETLEPVVDGSHIREVRSAKDEQSGRFTIGISFDEEGTQLWADGTRRNLNRHVAVVVDDLVYMAPRVMTPILQGKAQITGDFTRNETQWLTALIRGGELPLDLEVVGID